MSSLVWGNAGDHVGGKSEEAPGAWDEVSAVGTPPRRPAHPRCRPAGCSALLGSRASACGLARSGTKSRAVSREAKLQEHGDVESVKGKTLRPARLGLRARRLWRLGRGPVRVRRPSVGVLGGCPPRGRPGRRPPGTGTLVCGLGVGRLRLSARRPARGVQGPAEGRRRARLAGEPLWAGAAGAWWCCAPAPRAAVPWGSPVRRESKTLEREIRENAAQSVSTARLTLAFLISVGLLLCARNSGSDSKRCLPPRSRPPSSARCTFAPVLPFLSSHFSCFSLGNCSAAPVQHTVR